jgi:glycosyltransferase 2 family protein
MLSLPEVDSHLGASRLSRSALLALKLVVTALCFWYLAWKIDPAQFLLVINTLNLWWTGLAVLTIMLQIPLVGLRWCKIIDALRADRAPVRHGPIIAITMIASFLLQVVPTLAVDTVRVVMLRRFGPGWREGLAGVIIDRMVSIVVLVAIGFVTLLLPSALTVNLEYRVPAIEIFGAVLAVALGGVFSAPYLASMLDQWPATRWVGKLSRATYYVLLGSGAGAAIAIIAVSGHLLTIVTIWILGHALGLGISVVDASILFTVMVAVMLVPVSISGWGIRELAVITLLAERGVPVEQSLLLSLSFGLVLVVAALPGALVWALWSPNRSQRVALTGEPS